MNEPYYDGNVDAEHVLLLNMVDADDDNVMFFKRVTCPAWMIFPVQKNIRMWVQLVAREKFINN